jgi:hypothetical protein
LIRPSPPATPAEKKPRDTRRYAPSGDQRVSLDRRPEVQAEDDWTTRTIDRNTAFATEPSRHKPHARRDELTNAQRDHRECRTGATRRKEAEHNAHKRRRYAGDQGQQRQRHGVSIEDLRSGERAETGVNSMPKRQQSCLAKQQIERECEHDHGRGLREIGEQPALRAEDRWQRKTGYEQ